MKRLLTMMLLAAISSSALAQGTVADYKRANAVRGKYSNKMTYGDVNVRLMRGEGHKFWYSVWNG
ncbi:MAG: hypothetical protein IKI19_01405, partial [Prevotella sp.]|nr:hypothetical protein [Prevotella sp.]